MLVAPLDATRIIDLQLRSKIGSDDVIAASISAGDAFGLTI